MAAADTPSSGDRANGYESRAGDSNIPIPDPSRLTTQLVDRALSAFREVMETRLAAMDTAIILAARRIDDMPAEVGRDIQSLRELLESRLSAMDKATELLAATVGRVPSDTDKQVNALRELIGARIDGIDTATKLLAATVDTIPTDVDRAVTAATDLITSQIRSVQDVAQEKFDKVDAQFVSNDKALTAALAAQEKAAAEQQKSNTLAIDKSEKTTQETIRANAAQTETGIAGLASNLADVKERVVRLESKGVGVQEQRTDTRADATFQQAEAASRDARSRASIATAVAVAAVLATVIFGILLALKH